MQFHYQAKQIDGQATAGSLEATTLTEARQLLRQQGLFPIELSSGEAKAVLSKGGGFGRNKVGRTDLLMLTSQLSIMCQSGIDLAEAIRSAAADCRNPKMGTVLNRVYNDVTGGSPVSVALGRHPEVFGEAYIASIAAAESSGTINEVLNRLAELLRNEIRLRSAMQATLAYPVVLVAVAAVVLTALIFFVLPQFGKVFISLGKPPPPVTKLLIETAQLLRDHSLFLVAGAVVAGFVIWKIRKTDRAARYWDGAVINFPFLREATRSLLAGRMFRLMGTMLQTGVPLLEAVRLCRCSVKNRFFRNVFDSMEREVLNGCGLGTTIGRAKFIPAGAAQMVATAERTGKLGVVMQLIGEFYEDDGERQVRQLVRLLEPLVIVVMGAFVALIVLAVIVPLLDVSTMSR